MISAFHERILMFRGYIEAIREIEQQVHNAAGRVKFDDIVVACGRFCSISSICFSALAQFFN